MSFSSSEHDNLLHCPVLSRRQLIDHPHLVSGPTRFDCCISFRTYNRLTSSHRSVSTCYRRWLVLGFTRGAKEKVLLRLGESGHPTHHGGRRLLKDFRRRKQSPSHARRCRHVDNARAMEWAEAVSPPRAVSISTRVVSLVGQTKRPRTTTIPTQPGRGRWLTLHSMKRIDSNFAHRPLG